MSLEGVTYMNYYEYNDYLAHYGVKGMKWGVRRALREREYNRKYDNDGNLTKYAQRKTYKALKKGKYVNLDDHFDMSDDFDEYVDAYARRKAADVAGRYTYEHGRSNRLPEKQKAATRKNEQKMYDDFDNASSELDRYNKKMVDNMLGKYKDRKINGDKASSKLIKEAEDYCEDYLGAYGEMYPYYAKYLED